jgi:transposase
VQVLHEENRNAQTKSYMWVYRSGKFAANPAVIYEYQPSRATACVKDFLTGLSGYLLSDGYSAYDTLEQVTQAAGMTYARRTFTNAQQASPSKKSR